MPEWRIWGVRLSLGSREKKSHWSKFRLTFMHVFTNSFFQKGSKLNSALVAEAIHTLMLVLPHAFPWLRHTFQVWVHIICLVYKLHRHYRRVEKGLWIMVGLDFKPHLTAFTRVRVTNKITHLYADSQHIMPIKLWIKHSESNVQQLRHLFWQVNIFTWASYSI